MKGEAEIRGRLVDLMTHHEALFEAAKKRSLSTSELECLRYYSDAIRWLRWVLDEWPYLPLGPRRRNR